jgi:hypothetical protein
MTLRKVVGLGRMSHASIVVMLELGPMPVVVGIAVIFDLIAHSGVAICSPGAAEIEAGLAGRILVGAIRLTASATSRPSGRVIIVMHIVLVSRMLNGVLIKDVIASARIRRFKLSVEV